MPKIAKNEVFGHFFKFGWFDWSDIAYSDDKKRTQVQLPLSPGNENPVSLSVCS